MICKVSELKHKEIINARDGCRMGFVDDIEIDTKNACILSLVIYGKWRCFGLLGRGEDVIIRLDCIELIGEDTILVNYNVPSRPKKRFRDLFQNKTFTIV